MSRHQSPTPAPVPAPRHAAGTLATIAFSPVSLHPLDTLNFVRFAPAGRAAAVRTDAR